MGEDAGAPPNFSPHGLAAGSQALNRGRPESAGWSVPLSLLVITPPNPWDCPKCWVEGRDPRQGYSVQLDPVPRRFGWDFSIAAETNSIPSWTHRCVHNTCKLGAHWDSGLGSVGSLAEGLGQIPEPPSASVSSSEKWG